MRRVLLIAAVLLVPSFALATPWGFLVSEDGKQKLPLDAPSVVVGSGAKAAARIPGRTISKRHAVLTHDKGTVFVRDLGSRYGTLVAGTQIKKGRSKQLFKATLLTFGAQTWRFVWGDRGKLIPPLRKEPKAKGKASRARRAKKRRRGR